MPGFLGGSTGGGGGTGGEITFPKEFVDPVTKLRVSNPQNLIDTDFEYGLQPTKWETVELINNTPSFFSKSGDTTIPGIAGVTTNAGTREVIVSTSLDHGLDVGIPISVTGTKSVTADGAYIINSIPNPTTFTYLCRDIQPTTASIEDLYSSIITGEFFQGSQLRIADSDGITTDGGSLSELTVTTNSPHGFGTKTPFYFLNLNSTISQEFAAANTETKSFDSSNSATAQTFDGSNTLSSSIIDWSNSATISGIESDISSVDIAADTITVAHSVLQDYVGLETGTPLYYSIVSPGGYFLANPRGVLFLGETSVLGSSQSTIQLTFTPNGAVVPIETNLAGKLQIANQARVFAGNNKSLSTEQILTINNETPKTFDGDNSTGLSGTVTSYSGSNVNIQAAEALSWYPGTMLLYSTTGTAASGLANNVTYFIDFLIAQANNVYTFTLRPLPTSPVISSISGGSGVQTFKQIGVSIDKDIFHIENNGYLPNDMVRYDYPVGGRFDADEDLNFYFIQTIYDSHNFNVSHTLGEITPKTISREGTDAGTTITPTEMVASGFTAPLSFAVTSGVLPSGLTLNTSTGVVTGSSSEVIATPGRQVIITLTDSTGGQAIQTHTYQFNQPPVSRGQQQFTSPGTYSWVAPYSTNVSVVCIGGGAAGNNSPAIAGGGGGLGWKNNISVSQGVSYTVVVGGGTSSTGPGTTAGDSYFINTSTVRGGGGTSNSQDGSFGGRGGTFTGDGGGTGGTGGHGGGGREPGGGGAGGYAGQGGRGASESGPVGNVGSSSGNGGAGGGGGSADLTGGGGGGTGIFGQGGNGSGGGNGGSYGAGGGGGSSGQSGQQPQDGNTSSGGSFGGGGYGRFGNGGTSIGAGGAVRIIWGDPGISRAFPNTNTQNV